VPETKAMKTETSIGIVGLGYVGLPLAAAFGRNFPTTGFDIDAERVRSCQALEDATGEVGADALRAAKLLSFSDSAAALSQCNFIIVAVPTPVDATKRPDLSALIEASRTVGAVMQRGSVVIFESTVYPGVTEDVCVPELERASGMTWKSDFHVAYSPERVNPGDKTRTLDKIVKLVAADDEHTLEQVSELYQAIVPAGIYPVASIKVAEAAKVIENTQRDLNIALINELAIIFGRMNLDTTSILEAAGTKWNFLPFRPGLVGGHCIGVDPYYLTYKAQSLGYHPEVILAGRRINDGMGKYVAEKTVKTMLEAGIEINGAEVSILGVTFKENCPDLRNSQVFAIAAELNSYGLKTYLNDPLASPVLARREYGVGLCKWEDLPVADAVVLAVNHAVYVKTPVPEFVAKLKPRGAFIDVKSVFTPADFNTNTIKYWRL